MLRNLILATIMTMAACSRQYTAPASSNPVNGFDVANCPTFKSSYLDKDTNEKVTFVRGQNAITVHDTGIDFQVDGKLHGTAEPSISYVGTCSNKAMAIAILHKVPVKNGGAPNDIPLQLFYGTRGEGLDRQVVKQGKSSMQTLAGNSRDI